MRKQLGAGLIAGMLAWGCGCSSRATGQTPAQDPVTVAVARVRRQDIERTLRLAAEFKPYQEIDVYAKVAGYVRAIYVDIGDRVRAGQVLAVLEVPELADQLNQARAKVSETDRELVKAQSELRRAQAAHEAAHLQYVRLSRVNQTQPHLIAQQELDDARSRDQALEAEVAAAQAALAAAEERAQAARASEAQVRALYAYTRITAPFAGVVTHRYADTGVMLQAGTTSATQAMPLVRLSENQLLRLIVQVPEASVPWIHVGMPAAVEVPALHRTYAGRVARMADRVDFATRTMRTEIDVPNPNLELVPGMYAYASLVLEQHRQALTVPVQALEHEGDRVSVLRVGPTGILERVPVQLGLQTPDRAEVLGGLAEGDLVVVGSHADLQAGERVQVRLVEQTVAEGNR